MFARLAIWCHDRRRLVLAAWIGIPIASGVLSGTVGGAFRDAFNLPDVESHTGNQILEAHFGGLGAGQTSTIVFRCIA
jgi:RND superfamily putative drug exporter